MISYCLWPTRTSFHKVRLTEWKMKWSDKDTVVLNLLLCTKYRPGTLVLVKQAFCITHQVKTATERIVQTND